MNIERAWEIFFSSLFAEHSILGDAYNCQDEEGESENDICFIK